MTAKFSYGLTGPEGKTASNLRKTTPWLSLLIPSFEHPIGVLRILDRLCAGRVAGIECLVSDDSISDAVEVAVLMHPLYREGLMVYHRNRPGLGAVPNWNWLLARARGEYILLMHHDECPECDDFFPVLRHQVDVSNSVDVLFLDCLLPTMGSKYLRHHVPKWLRRFLMYLGPNHLLRHNTHGSPSVVVVRRSVCPSFDQSLKWLVDVEWMVRLLRQVDVRWKFAENLAVVSIPDATTSITLSLKGEISRINCEESRLIFDRFGASPVFSLLLPDTKVKKILSGIEGWVWLILRILTRSVGWVTSRPLPVWLRREI